MTSVFRFSPCCIILACLLPAAAPAQSQPADFCREADSLRIQSVDFQGLASTSPGVARRELRNRVGERFSCERWEAEQARLEDLDIFADVSLRTAVKDSQVALTYVVRELPPYLPFVALAKTEQDGLSLGPALASVNFLGQGIRAEFI